jgi:type IV pilus assembly protein PilM
MPLNNAVLDFHPLGVVDTPAGARQRVVLVAAQKDMIERLLAAVRRAGLRPEGVDLSAFALIRALYRPDPEAKRVLYLNVDGLTNLAIAEGTICRFTRVVGGGMEAMSVAVAERRGVALAEARRLVGAIDLRNPPDRAEATPAAEAEPAVELPAIPLPDPEQRDLAAEAQEAANAAPVPAPRAEEDTAFLETLAEEPMPAEAQTDAAVDVWDVVDAGIRDISGEVRNSLDFHRSQEGGGEVSHLVLSGAAEEIPGFAEALERSLGVPVRSQSVAIGSGKLGEEVSPHRLAVATGLSASEAPQ